MASTPEGRSLTEAHRQAQQDVRDEFYAEFIALWALLDTARLDETGPGWVAAVARAVAAYRLLSAQVATQYFYDFAEVEVPAEEIETPPGVDQPAAESPTRGEPLSRQQRQRQNRRQQGRGTPQYRRPRGDDVIPDPQRAPGITFTADDELLRSDRTRRTTIEIPDIDWESRDRAVEVSLNVTGPIGQKSKTARGKPLSVVRNESFVEASGAAARHVLDGGNRSALQLVTDDSRFIGYIRVTDSDPCSFCAMLASRGPVYKTPSSAGPNVRGSRNPRAGLAFVGEGAWKVHDHCQCTIEPVYSTTTEWPGRAREFQRMWNENIAGRYSGDEALRAWRRFYERQQREQRRLSA